ncbi:YncE family protein [Clostridium estertheticum]|uniref:YncE family protein n=1 Tax=Clostridium estertheticum TaxID=238834 RepID=UPI001CF1A58C|nr:YncE family protein [Clostridium estertheticum]MCB2306188.1 YncE family protein [Clostridium estertheticum]MCB2344361.1 YncE family protein [Clostridium estertheticum]MCB2349281.1 YncE family protein [Clostridium estertheticum]WAG45028.1 YncE family protein [Clostridium estertheticum]
MDTVIRKNFYFVSNVKTGTLTIIDGLCNTISKEITVGKRPNKLAIKDNNTIGIACDVSNTISFVNCKSCEIKEHFISNNGNLLIDKTNQKIYVSDTSEVTIYDMNLDKIINRIRGFSAITDIKLNSGGTRLYVLDTLLKELRIYSTDDTYRLINSIENVGINPICLLISKDDKTAYISTKIGILKLDVDSNIITKLILPKGSLINGMILNGNTLYASNSGLNRIELIDIHTNKSYKYILTSRTEPRGLFITDDNTKLLIANRSCDDYGGIDIIDLKSNSLISSIIMNTINSQPYDIISVNLPFTYAQQVAITNLNSDSKQITILAKRIFASYNENINFPIISFNLPKEINSTYIYKCTKFEQGVIVPSSECRRYISSTPELSSIKFIARVNYIIYYLKNNINKCINGFFEKPIDVLLDIPKEFNLNEFELNIKTTTKFINNPKFLNNVLNFGVSSLMELKVIGEAEIYLNNLKETDNFEEFTIFDGSIFPDDTIIPF